MQPALTDWFHLLTAFPRLYLAALCFRMACRLIRAGRERWGAETLVRFGVKLWPHDPIR